MATVTMTPALMEIVAARFKALGEPARLQILTALRGGERTVTELVEETGMSQPNLSKHLQMLNTLGFVSRRKDGLFVYYDLADRDIFRLCDIMCGRVQAEVAARASIVSSARSNRAPR